MKVTVKDLHVEMEIKNKGIELQINDSNGQVGDLCVTKKGLIWCKGRIVKKNGVSVAWADFVKYMDS